jgi:digeranylgeranylglycerophospholipid reductase
MHDVVIVGGGPAGCFTAALLAEKGFDVQLFEEHPVIGQPVDCTGVIGAEAFDALALPNSLRLEAVKAVKFTSPSDLEFRVSLPQPLAWIVDRAALDCTIAHRAEVAGAQIHLGARVVDITVRQDKVIALVEESNSHSRGNLRIRRRVEARMVILAGGPRYRFQSALGMGRPKNFLKTAQVEVPVHGVAETEVFVGSRIAPGSFAWIVPFQKENQRLARIGVSGKIAALPYLRKLLETLMRNGRLESTDFPIRSWVIPIGPVPRSYAHRALAVGDAAGQTKPTTGGGIYYGICSAHSAAHAVELAFARSDYSATFLARYERKWWQTLGAEIRAGALFRRISERLSDADMDRIFRIVRSDGILAVASRKLRFDWHRELISFVLKHPLLGSAIKKNKYLNTPSFGHPQLSFGAPDEAAEDCLGRSD